ncbi:GTP cyclohydrolase II RibA [Bradyrhizobium sacchari]|uniref:GTP cyclohydrolase II n=1 Tax=Bradyrhizobium sacchari TaxID=1399419 RepID=A0A560I254_9BRAD|nr:GTP cyclohydrolase II RibA [Bradyrhizobium sacchari]TWB51190.1 GTP cyclohydrolase II [Bradyrhizobium sacchari]TWB69424.1 GTP cyclohydrolase II [Bradyrhizobium sacchari]
MHAAKVRVRAVSFIPLNGLTRPTKFYTFDGLSRTDHFAIKVGDPSGIPLVRIHSECVTGDVFGSLRCDCGSQLKRALSKLDVDEGWILYLRQEGRGIGLAAKIDAYVLQEDGLDTFSANRVLGYSDDERDYSDAAQMLAVLGYSTIRLMSGNPEKAAALRNAGIQVTELVPCAGVGTPFNRAYLEAKEARTCGDPARAF